jgi:hypothetical protein
VKFEGKYFNIIACESKNDGIASPHQSQITTSELWGICFIVLLFCLVFRRKLLQSALISHAAELQQHPARISCVISSSTHILPLLLSLLPYSSSSLNSRGSLLLWQRGKSKVWLDNAELREQSLGLLVLDAGVDNHIITRNPVDRGGDSVLIASLEGVDDAEDLGGVAAGGCWVGHDEADGLLGVDNEDRADGERNALGVDIGSILVVNPIVRCQFGAFWNLAEWETNMS